VSEAPIQDSSPETGGYGLSGRSIPVAVRDRLDRPFSVRAVEAACRVAVARGDAPGVQLGADPALLVYFSGASVSDDAKRRLFASHWWLQLWCGALRDQRPALGCRVLPLQALSTTNRSSSSPIRGGKTRNFSNCER
jgi:hypothetical protein